MRIHNENVIVHDLSRSVSGMMRHAGALPVALLVLLFFSSCAERVPPPAGVKIIPRPVEVQRREGTFRLDRRTALVVADTSRRLFRAAEIFAGYVNASSSFRLVPRRGDMAARPAVVVQLGGDTARLGREGYTLAVTPERVLVTAAAPAGAFYGLQTLRQLFPPELEDSNYVADAWEIPCVRVFDRPRFRWRGDMLDVSRHFLPFEYLKKNIDYLARYKMNIFHWHLTDDQGWRIEVKGYPRLTEVGAWRADREGMPWWDRPPQRPGEKATYGGYYTREQVKELVRYAAERFVTIVPEIDMPGHSQAILAAYPELACTPGPHYVATGGRTADNTLCPARESTYRFVEGVLSEILPLFPGPYFHVGGDECNKTLWAKDPDCRALMRREGMKDVEELQSYFIRRVQKIVNDLGKRLVGWDEILEGGLAPGATVMSWRGMQGGIRAARMGHDVVMTPLPYVYLSRKQGDPEMEPGNAPYGVLLSRVYAFEPVPPELTAAEARHVLGTEGCLWTEFVPDEERADYMLFPRLLAVAEVAWSPAAPRRWEEFVQRVDYQLIRLDHLGIGYAPSMYDVRVSTLPDTVHHRVLVVLTTEHGGVSIRYTFDGGDPTPASPLYEGPVPLPEGLVTLKAASFREGRRLGRVTTKIFEGHMAVGATVHSSVSPSPRHDPGLHALVDGLLDGANMQSPLWTGWEGVSPTLLIDLGKADTLRTVTVNCLEAQRSRIFLPPEIRVLISRDGERFMTRGILYRELKKEPQTRPVALTLNIPPTYGRYLKIWIQSAEKCPDWHPAAGKKAWIFTDEVIVE